MKNLIVPFGVRRPFKKLAGPILALALFLVPFQDLLASYPNNIKDEDDEALTSAESGSTGLTIWQVSQPYINLWLFNQPLTYKTSSGQLAFSVAFKQRNNRPTTYAFGLGSGWESSWLSYVRWSNNGISNAVVGPTFMPLGGQRNYVGDGTTKEIKSASTMLTQYDGSGNVVTFTIKNPD